jgi:hypothetical protein
MGKVILSASPENVNRKSAGLAPAFFLCVAAIFVLHGAGSPLVSHLPHDAGAF